jgi:plastocyanin
VIFVEQKQLDEIDESYFGEEFIDEDVKDEKMKNQDSKKEVKPRKKAASKKTAKKVEKMDGKEEVKKKEVLKDSKEEIKVQPVSVESGKTEPEVTITPAKEESSFSAKDPWDDDENGESMFKEVSTWKAITGIAIILLAFSVFTNGFNFDEGATTAAVVEGGLTLQEAEQKAITYVNENLLQPPFFAELESSQETEGLYKVTLSVAGQSVDSFMTKNGNLFFPQGFDTNVDVLGTDSTFEESVVEEELINKEIVEIEEVLAKNSDEKNKTVDEVVLEEVNTEGAEEVVDEIVKEDEGVQKKEVVEPVVVPPVASGKTVTLSLSAKKWLFNPQTLTVSKGDTVRLNVVPEGLSFTFGVADLGVSQEVSGSTTVEFIASKSGNFEFSCSSCESWRGMVGTLVVK